MKHAAVGEDFASFREVARALLADGVSPEGVVFEPVSAPAGLFPELAAQALAPPTQDFTVRVPRRYVELAREVSVHRSEQRWPLLYGLLWRLVHGEPGLLADPADTTVLSLMRMRAQVQRDIHKTHAFVRFKKVERDGADFFIAWHRPDHRILPLAVPLFVRRFSTQRWSILTPDASAHWDLQALRFGPGAPRSDAPSDDALEDLWRSYYMSIFNPARVNPKMMRQEMPTRFWSTLPEARLIPSLLAQAPRRTQAMLSPRRASSASEDFIPADAPQHMLAREVQNCQACPLYANATRAVYGEGPTPAWVMLVGEQHGDQEDLQGRPFVGPAGQLLDTVLAQVGLPRETLYLTNAVKHFGFERRGKRRIHQTPGAREVLACRGWLDAEVAQVKPRIIVALGATAGQAFLGSTFRLIRSRGQFFETPFAPHWIATYHPSALLRMPDEAARGIAKTHFEADLRLVVKKLAELK